MRTPRHVEIEITSRCNLRCRYCAYFNNPVNYSDLPTAEWLQFFDELGALAVMDVTLTGGEVFTRTDIRQLLQGVVRNRMRFSLLSNGALIDDDLAAFLAATGRCNSVQISLDSVNPQSHDALRGHGAWQGAVRGLKALQRHAVRVNVRLTIHRHNVADLADTARFLLEDLGLPAFSTNTAGYLGVCRVHADDILLTTAQRQMAMETLLGLKEKYPARIFASAGPLSEGIFWREMETARAAQSPPSPGGGHLGSCGCTFTQLTVRADGAFIPCSLLPQMAMGRINRDALQEVWLHHPGLNHMRARRAIPLTSFAFCDGCPYLPYCSGGCPGLAASLTGQVDHPSPDSCLRLYLAQGGALPA